MEMAQYDMDVYKYDNILISICLNVIWIYILHFNNYFYFIIVIVI